MLSRKHASGISTARAYAYVHVRVQRCMNIHMHVGNFYYFVKYQHFVLEIPLFPNIMRRIHARHGTCESLGGAQRRFSRQTAQKFM